MPKQDDDPLIRVLVEDPIICMPASVMFDQDISAFARLVAALWFLLEREPTTEEIEAHLGYSLTQARMHLRNLKNAPSMQEYL
jgi:hypothetical protein